MRPRRVSATAAGSSKISFSMKVAKPPFWAASASQSTWYGSRSTTAPSASVTTTASGVISTTSSWPSSSASRVCSMKATTSEARKFSPSPRPTTSGLLRRAPTTTWGSRASTASSVKAPSRRRTMVRIASVTDLPPSTSRASRWPATSVSVSDWKMTPSAASSLRRVAKFSMMPLWMIAMRPPAARCGCALTSVGAPCVAQRVWPMAAVPSLRGCSASSLARLTSLPARLATSSRDSFSVTMAMPAES